MRFKKTGEGRYEVWTNPPIYSRVGPKMIGWTIRNADSRTWRALLPPSAGGWRLTESAPTRQAAADLLWRDAR